MRSHSERPRPGPSIRRAAPTALALLAGCIASFPGLVEKASFDHGCPEDRIRVLRHTWSGTATADLDVCGKVRRYQAVGSHLPTWFDVTNAYPASSLPAPTPPAATPAPPPSAGQRCESSADCTGTAICYAGVCRK